MPEIEVKVMIDEFYAGLDHSAPAHPEPRA
jgi:hypothetical protein